MILGLGELLDFGHQHEGVGVLAPVLGQQPLEILGVDCVRLLLDQVLYALLLLVICSFDLLPHSHFGHGGRSHSILKTLLDAILLI